MSILFEGLSHLISQTAALTDTKENQQLIFFINGLS